MSASAEFVTVDKLEKTNGSLKPSEIHSNHLDAVELNNDKLCRKELENGIYDKTERLNGVEDDEMGKIEEIERTYSENTGLLNGKGIDENKHKDGETCDEDKLLNEGSSDTGTGSVTNEDSLLNSDDDTLVVNEPLAMNGEETKESEECTDQNADAASQENRESSTNDEKVNVQNDIEMDSAVNENISSNEQEKASAESFADEISEKTELEGNDIPTKGECENDVKKESVDTKTTCEENMDVEKVELELGELCDKSVSPSRMEVIPSPEPIEVSKHKRISEQKSKIERLKDELRCEEATLALVRKLIDSQRGNNMYKTSSKHQNVVPSLHPKHPLQIVPKGTAAPLKQQPSLESTKSTSNSQQPVQKYYIQVGNQLVPAPPPSTPGSGPAYQYANGPNSNSHSSYQQTQPPPKPAPPKQTPEQKQNAAKAALRRQLEQTLLQIPPPRPPPADWRAIPNVNSMDFMMLVGLDEVVDTILDLDSKPTLKTALEELTPYNPRICSQCTVDFSPCWKTKDGDVKGHVLCERCSLQNVKKELKAEHTSRLKSAFLKALKQEQEIEEKIKAGEDVNISSITGTEKSDRGVQSPQQALHTSSPQPVTSIQPTNNHVPSPTERHHQSSSGHHHRHQVVQHYPHHQSLVQQLHHQHIQQQQLEMEPSSRHSSRWHPYIPPSSSHHHRDHHSSHHRSYVPASSSSSVGESSPHQEYYVVHHPQHAGVRYVNR